MMVLKTVFVSTFVAGTLAASDYDSHIIDLGCGFKLGKVDSKQKHEISGEVGGDNCKKHHFYYDTRNHTIQSDLRTKKESDPLKIDKFEKIPFLVKSKSGVQYFGLDIPVLKNEKPAYLSIICAEDTIREKIVGVLENHSESPRPKTFKFRNLELPSVFGSPQNGYRNVDDNIGFLLGHAAKCKIVATEGVLTQLKKFKSPDVREFFYHPGDHSIGFQSDIYKTFKIRDYDTEAMNEIGATVPLIKKKVVEGYAWTIIVEKKGKPSYLHLAFGDRENMEEFQRRFRQRAAEKLRIEGKDVEVNHTRFPSVYGSSYLADRRRLMTRRRLALERLYRAESN